MFFHGPPGTGKTYALRALITQWEPWCRPELIVDPDVAFRDSAYLTRVVGSDHGITKSRLLVCEDIDDLITSRRTGGLERLLNLADGILGQGLNLVILTTTNVRPVELDAALIRPGRCMANIDFEHFSIEEARARLFGTGRPVTTPMTLAELFEAEGAVTQVHSAATTPPIGTYL